MTKAERGVYAAVISPFDADGNLDLGRLASYCKYIVSDGGCDGVAPAGTNGEGASISLRQRLGIPSALGKAGISTEKVILGAGCPAADDTVEIIRSALGDGYANFLVLPAYFYKGVSDEGLFRYFARIVENVGSDDLRIYLYHFPKASGVGISPALVVKLREEFGAIIAGIKDSSGDFAQSAAFAEATGGVSADFDVYPSSEAFLFRGQAAGCAGIISGTTNMFGRLVKRARLADASQRQEALDRVVAARGFATGFPLVGAMKYGEFLRSGDENWLRMAPPLLPLTQEQKAEFQAGVSEFVG